MTTFSQTLMHMLKGAIGVGAFSMGIAFKNGGMVLALVITPLMGLLVLHCITILVRVIEVKSLKSTSHKYLKENKTYADIVEEVFSDGPPRAKSLAKYMKILINLEICICNLGFCCLYIVFVGNNMEKALRYFDVDFSVYVVMLIFTVPMWLCSLLTNLKYLAPVSTFANVILVTAIVITLYFICSDLSAFNTTKYVAGIDTIPLFLAVALYSFDNVTLIVPLRNEMDKPEKMRGLLGILNMGYLIIIPIVVSIGFFSYLKYGDDVKRTIFLSLPEDNKLVQSLVILVCMQALFSYPVQLYAPVTIMWPMVVERYGPFRRPTLSLLCFRTLLVILTLAISEAIPFIDLVMSLIGAICSTCLALFIPAVVEIIVFYGSKDSTTRRAVLITKNALIVILAVIIFVTGIFTSIRDIIYSF